MRAKTKKDLILQLIIVAIVLPLIIWWHPTGPYRVVVKWGALALSGVLYFLLNYLWKWKEADEDETPLWYEKKEKQEKSINEKPKDMEVVKTVQPTVNHAEITKKDKRNNQWLIVVSVALAVLMAVVLVRNTPTADRGNNVYINNETGVQQPLPTSELNDGTYCYKGEWKGEGLPQKCRLEFTVKDGLLSDALYTNINYNVQIPLQGRAEGRSLIFTNLGGGQSLTLDLSFPDQRMLSMEGYGMDYEHENSASQIVLRRVFQKKHTE